MSAGHSHKRPNLRHPSELKHLLAGGEAPELMKRWQSLDVDHDVTDLAGYNVAGTVRYLDKDFFRALLDPDYATEILGEPIETGLRPHDTVDCILRHEAVEKVILDGSNDVDSYLGAHELATTAEHDLVRSKGGKPIQYERGLKKAIAYCEAKTPKVVAQDFACAPLLDDPDKHDHRALRAMRKLGIADAFKAPKRKFKYGRSTGADRCDGCEHWLGDLPPPLSRCSEIDGAVRADRWCSKFEAKEAQDGQGDGIQAGRSGDRQEPQDQEPGGGAGLGNPQGEPGGQAQEPKFTPSPGQ